MRTTFERDRDRIMHSKAFRRLKHKTQVFVNPEDDHHVTRLTHTIQVTQIARALAAALSLNEAARRGHRAGPRRRPLAVRAYRGGGALAVLPDDRRLAPRRPERARLRGARGPQPLLGGPRRHPGALLEDRPAAHDRRRPSASATPTASPTSPTTRSTRCAPGCSRPTGLPAGDAGPLRAPPARPGSAG